MPLCRTRLYRSTLELSRGADRCCAKLDTTCWQAVVVVGHLAAWLYSHRQLPVLVSSGHKQLNLWLNKPPVERPAWVLDFVGARNVSQLALQPGLYTQKNSEVFRRCSVSTDFELE